MYYIDITKSWCKEGSSLGAEAISRDSCFSATDCTYNGTDTTENSCLKKNAFQKYVIPLLIKTTIYNMCKECWGVDTKAISGDSCFSATDCMYNGTDTTESFRIKKERTQERLKVPPGYYSKLVQLWPFSGILFLWNRRKIHYNLLLLKKPTRIFNYVHLAIK